jgi:hypothetical protein
MDLPDIDFEEPRFDSAAPSFSLYEHGDDQQLFEFSDLLSNHDAIVIGLFTPSSPYAEIQRVDFEIAQKVIDDNIAFIQIATGEGVNSLDLDKLVNQINGSWPVLIDNADSSVGKSFPSRASDSVFVIDSAGFISTWKPGTMSSQSIEDAVESSYLGSGNLPLDLIGLIFGTTFLPLIVLAMPRGEKYEVPNSPLIPGAGIVLTLFSSSIGFALWALPVSLLSILGLGSYWIYVELVLSLMLFYHGLSMLLRGGIREVEISGRIFYSKLPEPYRVWWKENKFLDDMYLGLWVAWLLWLRVPSTIPQAIGAVGRSGLIGLFICILFFIGYMIMAGLVVVIFKTTLAIIGDLTRILGSLTVGLRPRAWGLTCAILGMWVLLSIVVGPLMIN